MMEITYKTDSGTYSPEDFARMRAGRLLFNDPPPMADDDARINQMDRIHEAMMESHIRGSNSPISVEHCAIHVAHQSFGDKPEFLQFARLLAIYFIRCGGVAEEVLELSLGSTNNDEVHVKFRGRRRRVAINVDPAIIEVEGVCPLSARDMKILFLHGWTSVVGGRKPTFLSGSTRSFSETLGLLRNRQTACVAD